MLSIRRETDYAVRTVLHLASVGAGVHVSVREVAEQRALPLSFVRRIVARLRAAGILATTRGMGGGTRLARPASEISMLDVVRAMEGPVSLNPCVLTPHTCPLRVGCPAQQVWREASSVLERHLEATRFDAMATGSPQHVTAHRRLTLAVAEPASSRRAPSAGRAQRRQPRPADR